MQPSTQKSPSKHPHTLTDFASIAYQCRLDVLTMLTMAKSSHLGSALSIIDILVVLYHAVVDPQKIKHQQLDRDYVLLSKGHGAAALYTALVSAELIDRSLINNYHANGTILPGLTTRNVPLGIEATTGSLGQGLSMGVGLAIAAQHDKRASQVYVLVGDGECQEGPIWEALMVAERFNLTNLTVIVDYNKLQAMDPTDSIMTGSFIRKFEAFGCHVVEVNGHDYQALLNAFINRATVAKPYVIIAHTIKGKGIARIENKLEWHYRSFTAEEYATIKHEVVK
jgi:transketolase